jgi:hypothetical protein
MPEHAFCSPQKVSRFTWGRSPGSEGAARSSAGRFTFPSRKARWLIEATRPRLQWRNRAGFAPDFPVMPVIGTRRRPRLYHSMPPRSNMAAGGRRPPRPPR